MRASLLLPAGLLCLGALGAHADEASDLAQPVVPVGIAQTIADAADGEGREAAPPETGSRLLRSLSERAVRTEGTPAAAVDARPDLAENADDGVVFGCPRSLLAALLAGAAETLGPETLGPETPAPETPAPVTGDAVSALAIEREVLALCRERQEIVTGIVTLEGELRELLTEQRHAGASPAPVAGYSIVKESMPVRVVSLPPAPEGAVDTADEPERVPGSSAVPAPPAYAWFSIIGTAGDLRAGISDGPGGGARVWFVREGERLPGAVTVTAITGAPPGVSVAGAGDAILPYRPRPRNAMPAGADR